MNVPVISHAKYSTAINACIGCPELRSIEKKYTDFVPAVTKDERPCEIFSDELENDL